MCSNHELQATLNALGYLEDGEYYKSRDCLNGAKDLVRYLRRDDPNEKTVRRELLKSDVISNDLIPLIKVLKPKKDAELFDLVLRLLVNLTQSALNCFELQIPEDKLKYNIFIEIDNYLIKTKEPFSNESFIKVITDRLREIVTKSWEDRPEEEDLIAERILFLIRNVLQIKLSDDDVENRLETDLNSHDLMLLCFHKSNVFDIIVEMTNSNNHSKYFINLLEIMNLILRDQSPEELAKVSENEVNLNSKRSVVEKERDNDELVKLTMKDQYQRKSNKMRLNPRHSRFMGTYVAVNMKSINDENNLIVHKQAKNMDDLLDDSSKKMIKKAKNKVIFEKEEQSHRSVLFIRIILKKFCLAFMQKSYSNFFRNLKDQILRKKLEDDEICYYYSLIQFLTEFNRNTDLDEQTKMEQIKETFSTELFHSIEVYIQRCTEMMKMDKKLSRLWAKRMHISMKCYKENLVNLFVLEKKISTYNTNNKIIPSTTSNSNEESDLVNLAENLLDEPTETPTEPPNETEPKSLLDERTNYLLTKLKNQIFNIQEFRELFLTLLKDFDQSKMTKSFLRDLIEANHIFILLLEYHLKKNGTLSVLSKKKKKKPKKKTIKKKETKEEKEKRLMVQKEYRKRVDEQETKFKEKIWDKNFSKIASLIQNETELKIENDNLMPFDFVATSDQEFDSQKDVVIEKIQHLLSLNKPDDSLALFREARCLWPNDRDLFGSAQVEADEEFEIYKNLIMKQLEIIEPVIEVKEAEAEAEAEPEQDNKDEGIEEEDDLFNDENKESNEYDEENNEEDAEKFVMEEENLEIDKFLFRYTQPRILKCYILMLSEYAKNSDFLNRCCMSMFEKIAYDCSALQSLYQLSLFNLINTMHKDPMSRCIMNISANNTQKKSIDDLYASNYSCEDMFAFFRQLVGKFFDQCQRNNKLFLEILFFKEKKMIYCLGEETTGYEPMFAEPTNNKKRKVAWTEEERDELKELFEKYQPKFEKTDDDEINKFLSEEKLEGDLIDQIMLHIKDGSRKRRDLCNQLVNLGFVKSIEDFKLDKYTNGNKKLGRNGLWRPEDIDDLKQCFTIVQSEAKQADSPLNLMMHKLQDILTIKRSKKQIAYKMVELGLIDHTNEILSKKSKSDKKTKDNFMNSDSDNEATSTEKPKKKKSKKSKKPKSGNDLFDAESGSESGDSDSSVVDSSESDSEPAPTVKKAQRNIAKLQLDDDDEEEQDKSEKLHLQSDDDETVTKKVTSKPDEPSQNSVPMNHSNESNDSETVRENKKRKMKTKHKFRIVDDDSDSNEVVLPEKKDKALSEISNSELDSDQKANRLTGKMNYSDVFNKLLNNDENGDDDESEDSEDDDLPLSALVSKPKRQKLVLSDDDE